MNVWRFNEPLNATPQLHGSLDIGICILSLFLAVLAAFVMLPCIDRIRKTPSRNGRLTWLAAGATTMGSGIWGMHFTAMVAFTLPVPITYDIPITILSVLPAILGCACMLRILSRPIQHAWHLSISSLSLAAGIGSMHYIGMEAMRTSGMMHYSFTLFLLSIGAAWLVASIGILINTQLQSRYKNHFAPHLLGAVVMGIAVTSMHFIAMMATHFHEGSAIPVNSMAIPPLALVVPILILFVLITGVLLIGIVIDTKFSDTSKELNRLAAAMECSADSIAIYDRNWKLRYANAAYQRHTGWQLDEALGKHASDLQTSDHYEEIENKMNAGSTWSGRRRTRLRDGRKVDEEATVSPIPNSEGVTTSFVSIIRDVTSQAKLERQLIQAQKLESIGQLAAGIAHEINTPIQYVGDNTQFVSESFESISKLLNDISCVCSSNSGNKDFDSIAALLKTEDIEYFRNEIPKALEQSLEGVEHVSNIVRAMKEFSHPAQDKIPLDLNAAIQNTITVATNEWKYVADICTGFDSDLPPVVCVPGELNQVFLNIIVNAAHAIADKQIDSADEKGQISIFTKKIDQFAEIIISDTGSGMTDAVKENIFDPFFTTKEIGKGTGQGLAIVHNIVVEKHSGSIQVESEVDTGSSFIIRIPIRQERDQEQSKSKHSQNGAI